MNNVAIDAYYFTCSEANERTEYINSAISNTVFFLDLIVIENKNYFAALPKSFT